MRKLQKNELPLLWESLDKLKACKTLALQEEWSNFSKYLNLFKQKNELAVTHNDGDSKEKKEVTTAVL